MSLRARAWCFTINNPVDNDLRALAAIESKYIIYGTEVGEDGTPHLQGFVSFHNAKSMSACRRCLGNRAHVEKKRGTFAEASDYCKKDGIFIERGIHPKFGPCNWNGYVGCYYA